MKVLAVRIILYRWKLQDTRELTSSQMPVFVIFLDLEACSLAPIEGFSMPSSPSAACSLTPQFNLIVPPRNPLSSQMCPFMASTLTGGLPFLRLYSQDSFFPEWPPYNSVKYTYSPASCPEQAIGNEIAANLSLQVRGEERWINK